MYCCIFKIVNCRYRDGNHQVSHHHQTSKTCGRVLISSSHVFSSSIQPAANASLSNIDADMVRVPPEFINVVATAFRWRYILLQLFQFLFEFYEIADCCVHKTAKTLFFKLSFIIYAYIFLITDFCNATVF